MKFYQFINEHNIKKYTKKYVIVDGKQISHPSEDTLLKAGIKPLVEGPMPEYDEYTQYLEPYYVDGDTEITKKWRIIEVNDYESADA